MSNQSVCAIHGPYDAALGRCPYCSGQKAPQAPRPLSEDDLPTDLGGVQRAGVQYEAAEEPTDIGPRRRRSALEDEEETDIGRRGKEGDDVTVLEHPVEGAQAIFWVKEGRRRGKIHILRDGMVIGRKACDLIIDDEVVSGDHAKIALRDNQVIILDLLSKNGTFVNGEKILAQTTLKENDTVRIGPITFVVKILE